MSQTNREINCQVHGKQQAAYVCQHLLASNGNGFHWASNPDNPFKECPDAWCNECNSEFKKQNAWTEEATTFANIKVICELCYGQVREHNWTQDNDLYSEHLSIAMEDLRSKQDEINLKFDIGKWSRYDWDSETEKLIFSQDGISKVIADIVFVGSLSTKTNTWLWSWANESHTSSIRKKTLPIKHYGENNRFLKLAASYWSADEVDGWEMTAFAANILDAKGSYRTPTKNGFTYMVITNLRWVS